MLYKGYGFKKNNSKLAVSVSVQSGAAVFGPYADEQRWVDC